MTTTATASKADKSQAISREGEEQEDALPELPFVTTSEVLNQLNKQLSNLSEPGETLKPRFELNKRLPDGSAIPANEADVAYSDLQNKLQQSAKFVSQLIPSDRVRWAEGQRQTGNAYFQRGEYKASMDIYLTCLVVKDDSVEFVAQTLIPVLTNLAQCTLQLRMHKKTMEFCNIALEEVKKSEVKTLVGSIALCKLHFKRAKARRLTGEYGAAREDLNRSLECLDQAAKEEEEERNGENDSRAAATANIDPYRQAIQKEFRHLQTAEKEARKNRQRQKRAMKKVLSQTPPQQKHSNTQKDQKQTPSSSSLFREDKRDDKGSRQYSTLRARKVVPEEEEEEEPSTSYWQHYLLVVAHVAEILLVWMGDEETKDRLRKKED